MENTKSMLGNPVNEMDFEEDVVVAKELSSPKRIIVPTPKYVVFYNGKERYGKMRKHSR